MQVLRLSPCCTMDRTIIRRTGHHFIPMEAVPFALQTHADICNNLVPIEIALRCARAIHEGQPFAAYIIIPMWPEGGDCVYTETS